VSLFFLGRCGLGRRENGKGLKRNNIGGKADNSVKNFLSGILLQTRVRS
jgi:hypothetical protein